MAMQIYPEDRNTTRPVDNVNRHKQLLIDQSEGLVADITVSHGFFVDDVAAVIGNYPGTWCDYCAITSYKLSAPAGATDIADVVIEPKLGSNSDHV